MKPPEILTVTDSSKIEGEMSLGVFWPADVFEAVKGAQLPKSKRKSYKWNGKLLWGITLPESDGNPPGTIKLRAVNSLSIEKKTEVESSEKEVRSGQLKDTFAKARASLGSGVAEKKIKLDDKSEVLCMDHLIMGITQGSRGQGNRTTFSCVRQWVQIRWRRSNGVRYRAGMSCPPPPFP